MHSSLTYLTSLARTSLIRATALVAVLGLSADSLVQAQTDGYVRTVDTLSGALPSEDGAALVYSPLAKQFLVVAGTNYGGGALTVRERVALVKVPVAIDTAANVTFDGKANRLLVLNHAAGELVEILAGDDGIPDGSLSRTPTDHLALEGPHGIAVDPDSGDLYILDRGAGTIVRVAPDGTGGFGAATPTAMALQGVLTDALNGIAFDPTSGDLYILGPSKDQVCRISPSGQILDDYDLSSATEGASSLLAAPTSDATDDPTAMSLFVGEAASGELVELSMTAPLEFVSGATAIVVQTIDSSLFSPPSPDPAGIAYNSSSDTLIVADSEVDEMTIFAGVNLFELLRSGALVDGTNTLAFSDEPTGAAYDAVTGHLFITDDDAAEVYEIDPGGDGRYGTPDDVVTSFDTSVFGGNDIEGITYDVFTGELYLVDGINSEVYRVNAGPNGVFDGVAPAGDDVVTQFDTASIGVTDPEGIAFDTENGHLYIVGLPVTTITELTTDGTFLRTIDIASASPVNPAGLAFAPSSVTPGAFSLFLTDRGVDNDSDPNENDGKIFELSFPPITAGNQPPQVFAGADRQLVLPGRLTLDGSATDDGIPTPPGSIQLLWKQVSGEGSVTFTDPTLGDTTALFSTAGTYVLRLSASDGELATSDDLTVTVTGDTGVAVVESRVNASTDDAEERFGTNQGVTTSPDLELVFDGGAGQPGDQTVGMRFNGLAIPQGAIITNAFVQFQTNAITSEPTFLNVQGEANDNPVTFVPFKRAITSRPRTLASVAWEPEPWLSVGESAVLQRTPNLANVVQEIVNRTGWASGNSLVIIIDGTGQRTAWAYDGLPAGAPLLHVEYLPPGTDGGSFEAHFDADSEGFGYVDDAFRSTSQPDYADGIFTPTEGFDGGGLSVQLGGIDDADITGMSGGWRRAFTLTMTQAVSVSLRYNLTQAANYESNELSEALLSIDGVLFGADGNDYLARIVGDGNGGNPQTTGWVQVVIDAGDLPPGAHTLTIGAFNNLKTFSDQTTELLIDDVRVTVTDPGNTAPGVSILSPPNGSIFVAGNLVDLTAVADDAQEGDLSSSIAWTSSLDGAIGTGAAIAPPLSLGVHVITASASDIGGLVGSDMIQVEVVPPNTAPMVTISSPADGSSFGQGASVSFAASVFDAEDGDISSGLVWTSDRDGAIGQGGAFITTTLSIGSHTITASVTDSGGLTGLAAITLNVTPSFEARFDTGTDGFLYMDDEFRGTSQPAYANGAYTTSGGFSGGGLLVTLGGVDDADISGMSGGWQRDFQLPGIQSVSVTLRYNLTQAANYESNELSQALFSIDGRLVGVGGNDYLAQIRGDGNGGSAISTGWVQVTLDLGNLSPGAHELALGGFNNLKTFADESTSIRFDDVVVSVGPPVNEAPIVAISSPADGAIFQQGGAVTFAGAAKDVLDGDLSASLSWTSSRDGAIGTGASFSASSLTLGVHTITASVTDSGGLQGAAAIRIAVTATGALSVLDKRVATGSDDAEERSSGSMYLDSSDLELVTDGSVQTVGMRFDDLDIPAGSTIFKAYVQFQVDERDSAATALTIRGEAANDAATFTDTPRNITQRPTTAARIAWSPVAWTNVGQQGLAQRTPDLTSVVQEIVGRPAWQSGNALALIVTGTGVRTAESYEGLPSAAAKLHVEYVIDPSVIQPVTVQAEASKDTYTEEDNSNNNHGGSNDLKVKPDAGKRRHSMVAFDLGDVPMGQVVSATLMLWEDGTKDGQTISVHRVTSDWVENEATWNDRDGGTSWTTPGGDFDPTPVGTFAPNVEKVYREVDVTSVVRDWVSGSQNYGFLIRSTGVNGEIKFKSREEGDFDRRPRLTVIVRPSSVQPVKVQAEASKDTYTEEDNSNNNHGDSNDLKVKPDAGKRRHSMVAFDLDQVPAGQVVSATLLLWEDGTRDGQKISVHRLTRDWVEDEVTWNDRDTGSSWTNPGGDFDPTPVGTFAPNVEKVYREVDVTGVVRDWVNGSQNYGFLIRSSGVNGEIKFKSREEGNLDKRPRLVIEVVP